MNFGNLDVEQKDQVVVLRMRHVVDGHPGCWLSYGEIVDLAHHLLRMVEKKAPKIDTKIEPIFDDLLG